MIVIANSESVHGTDLSSGNRQRLSLVFPHGVPSMYKIRSTRNEFQTIFNDTSQRVYSLHENRQFHWYPLIKCHVSPSTRTKRTSFHTTRAFWRHLVHAFETLTKIKRCLEVSWITRMQWWFVIDVSYYWKIFETRLMARKQRMHRMKNINAHCSRAA